jgi:hypothetical protein
MTALLMLVLLRLASCRIAFASFAGSFLNVTAFIDPFMQHEQQCDAVLAKVPVLAIATMQTCGFKLPLQRSGAEPGLRSRSRDDPR